MPGCDIKISNPDEKGVGEICMRGRNTMMGYLKNEAATQDTLDEFGYVKSGDIGKFDERGFLRITGRIKELIITAGGENIAPVPIEDNFKKISPIVSNIMLVGEMQRFMGALITIKADIDLNTGVPSNKLAPEAKAFLKSELKLDLQTTDEACTNKEVQKYIQKCVEETNKLSVSRAAHIRKFKLLPIDFSIPGGELTPTLKLKRKVTEKKYK
jgi:long-chain-fatty-acid--CoA ligase ACSBG